MEVYGGIDLHGNNSVVVLIDAGGKVVYRKRLVNEWPRIQGALEAFRDRVQVHSFCASPRKPHGHPFKPNPKQL